MKSGDYYLQTMDQEAVFEKQITKKDCWRAQSPAWQILQLYQRNWSTKHAPWYFWIKDWSHAVHWKETAVCANSPDLDVLYRLEADKFHLPVSALSYAANENTSAWHQQHCRLFTTPQHLLWAPRVVFSSTLLIFIWQTVTFPLLYNWS